MKRILALVLVSVMMVSSALVVSAEEPSGSKSPAQERIEELEKEVKEKQEEIEKQQEELKKKEENIKAQEAAIAALTQSLRASEDKYNEVTKHDGGSRSSAPTSSGNTVSYGGTVTYQGGKVEINGGKSNVTFTIKAPSNAVVKSAGNLANQLGGTLLTCINTSTPGVAFSNAKVNFFISGVQDNENIAVYQNQGGSWVQLVVAETRKDHVVVNLSQNGDIAFVRVPVMAVVTR